MSIIDLNIIHFITLHRYVYIYTYMYPYVGLPGFFASAVYPYLASLPPSPGVDSWAPAVLL